MYKFYRCAAFDHDHVWPIQSLQPFSESRPTCIGNTSYDISLLTCTLCPINSLPSRNGKSCFIHN